MLSLKLYSLKFEIYEHFLIFTKMPHSGMKDIWFYYFILEPLLLFNSQAHTYTSIKDQSKKKTAEFVFRPLVRGEVSCQDKNKIPKNVFHYTEKEEIKTSKDLQNSKDGPVKHLT